MTPLPSITVYTTFTKWRERQAAAQDYRIPDICVVAAEAVGQKIVTTPPDLCIEILPPEDTLTRTMERVRNYLGMGVSSCWVIDPVSPEGWVATPGQLHEVPDGILRAKGIEMPLAEALQSIVSCFQSECSGKQRRRPKAYSTQIASH